MRRYLLIFPALLLAALAACNGSGGSSDNNVGAVADTLNPTAAATETAPPTVGQLPTELLPPS